MHGPAYLEWRSPFGATEDRNNGPGGRRRAGALVVFTEGESFRMCQARTRGFGRPAKK